MASFEVGITVKVEAKDSEKAFAEVRSNYRVLNKELLSVDFHVNENPTKLEDEEKEII